MRIFCGGIGPVLGAVMLMTAMPFGQAAAQDLPRGDMADEALSEAAADSLKPGDYRWEPQRAAEGPLTMIVSISRQMAYVYRGGALIGVSTVSTGKPGHDTPVGTFSILQKKVDHRSTIYDGAPMPFMQRLTWDGIALHAGQIPGHPASHGCVRLPAAFAKLLYGATKIGMTVTIQDEDQYAVPMNVADAAGTEPESPVRMAGYIPAERGGAQ